MLITSDSQSNPQVGVTEARRLVSEDVKAMIVLDVDPSRDAALPVFTEAGIPFISGWGYEGGPAVSGGSDATCAENFWSTSLVPNVWVISPMEYLVNTQGIQQWFMIGSDYGWPRTMNAHAAETVEANGGETLGEEYLPLGTTEFGTLVTQLMGLGEGVGIVNNLVGADFIGFMKQWADAGGDNSRMISMQLEEILAAGSGPSADGAYGTTDYFQAVDTPANANYLARLQEMFGDDTALQTFASVGAVDAIKAWAAAANEAGSFELDAINSAMEGLSLEGPRGTVQFLPNRHMAVPNLLGIAEGGAMVVVEDFGVQEPVDQCPA